MDENRSPEDLQRLRSHAEAQAAHEAPPAVPQRSADELLHELRVHQIELEMQNDELRRTQHLLELSRDRYLDLYDFAPVAYLTLSSEGLIIEANLTGAALLGEVRARLLKRRFAAYVAAVDADRWHRFFVSLAQHGDKQSIELALQTRQGAPFHARLDCLRVQATQAPAVVRITLADISERVNAQAELRIAATAFEGREAIIVTDERRLIQRVNQAFTDMTGYAAEEVAGQVPQMFRIALQGIDFQNTLWERVHRSGSWQGEIWDRRKGGEVFPAWLTVTAVAGADGVVTHFVASFSDMSERKAAENEIRQLAFYDPLTQLPNRRLLLERLQQALSTCTTTLQHGALLFIDLDNFKSLNDTRGHFNGDLLLQKVAQRLSEVLRQSETVARLGGDEFVVLLENLGEARDQALARAQVVGHKIIAKLDEPYRLAGTEYCGTPSIGLTLFGAGEDSVAELLKQADLAMYQAKAAGRNTLCVFEPQMRTAASNQAALEADLRQALNTGGFLLHYQPQVDRDGRLKGVEALLRWQHPRREMILPAQFISVAEQTGLIVPVGQWVLQRACAQLATWAAHAETACLSLSVNISAAHLHHPQFVEHVRVALEGAGIDGARLILELTESMLLQQVEGTISKMSALRAIGVRFSLDDFGTGYSSLSYLKRLLLYQVKVDRSFVQDILTDAHSATIARTIVSLGRSLGLSVVAEGVETVAQRDYLSDLGCQLFQGFLFGQATPAETLRAGAFSAA